MIVHKNPVELMHKVVMLEKLSVSLLPPIVIKQVSYLIGRWQLVCARIQAHFIRWNILTIFFGLLKLCGYQAMQIAQYLTVLECLSVFCLSCLDKCILKAVTCFFSKFEDHWHPQTYAITKLRNKIDLFCVDKKQVHNLLAKWKYFNTTYLTASFGTTLPQSCFAKYFLGIPQTITFS